MKDETATCSMCLNWCGQCGQVILHPAGDPRNTRACGPTHAVMKNRLGDYPEHPHGPPPYGPNL